jgi:hypothetical protein
MLKAIFVVLVLASFFAQDVCAGQPEIQAAEVIVTTGIQNRTPVDTVRSYAASVGTLYCYCRIIGADSETTVWQVWYHNGREVTRTALPVRSSNWKTWSKKVVPAAGRGDWRVDVLDGQGKVLGSQRFKLL